MLVLYCAIYINRSQFLTVLQVLIISRESLCIKLDNFFGEIFFRMVEFSLEVIIDESLAIRIQNLSL